MPVTLSAAEFRQRMAGYHIRSLSLVEAFERLGTVQFDPLSPVGSNHDLVLQARVPDYRPGDWQEVAYNQRKVYDGWSKQACLIDVNLYPFHGVYHQWYDRFYNRIQKEHPYAIEAVLAELTERGPMSPRDFDFQEHKEQWKGSWFGPSVTKQTLRALWHKGLIMTANRKSGQHLYDLTERVLPKEIRSLGALEFDEQVERLIHLRHRSVGFLQVSPSAEVWTLWVKSNERRKHIESLVRHRELVEVKVDKISGYAVPEFLDLPIQLPEHAVFIAPLDPLTWDRKVLKSLWDFEYIWEVYKPESERRWGYYVLPVLLGDRMIARVEFFCRKSVLEIRQWYWEEGVDLKAIASGLEEGIRRFLRYSGSTSVEFAEHIPKNVRALWKTR